MAWYNFLRIPLSKKESAPEKKMTLGEELRSFVYGYSGDKPVSLVYIQVDKGNSQSIANFVGGRLLTPRTIVAVMDGNHAKEQLEGMIALDQTSEVRVGSAVYPRDGETVTRLLLRAQEKFTPINYEIITKACPEQPSLPYQLPVPA